MLAVHRREDGERVHECEVSSAPSKRGGQVVVTHGMVAVRVPPYKSRTWAILKMTTTRDAPELKLDSTRQLLTQPLGGRNILIALTDKRAFAVLRVKKPEPPSDGKKKHGRMPLVFPLVGKSTRPDLIFGATSPIFMANGTVCFGTWAADINSNLIFWHLDEHKSIRDFEKGLRFGAVPAGHERLLVVSRDGKALYAIGPGEFEK